EHVPEPVDDDRLANAFENPSINRSVVVRRTRDPGQGARGHQHDATADSLDRLDLLFVGADNVIDAPGIRRSELIGATTGEDEPVAGTRGGHGPADEFERSRPVDAHSALRGVHRLGDAKPEAPQMLAKGDRTVPVNRAIEPGIVIRQWVGHHVRGGECSAVELAGGPRWEIRRGRKPKAFDRSVRPREIDCNCLQGPVDAVHAETSSAIQKESAGMSTHRRSFQLCIAASTSWRPFAPSRNVYLYGASSTRWRMNISHCTLKPLSKLAKFGTGCQDA